MFKSPNKKILFIGHSSKVGGAQKVLADVINSLSSQSNYECHVVCPNFQGNSFENLLEKRNLFFFNYLPFISNSSSSIKHILGIILNLPVLFYLIWYVINNRINIIYINSSTNFVGIILSSITRVRTILHVHEQNNSSIRIIPKYIKFFYKYFVKSDFLVKIIFPSKMTQKSWENFLDTSFFNGDKLYAPIYIEEFNRTGRSDIFTIGFVGSLFNEKNIFTLLYAFLNLLNLNSTKAIKLKIVGVGPLKEDILKFAKKNNVSQNIIVLDHLTFHSEIYSDMSVLVQPSFMESWSLVSAEALFYKIPVVISNKSGITEILTDKTDCLFFNPLDADALVKCLNLLLNDLNLSERIAIAGFENIRSLNLNYIFKQEICSIINNA
jgi:glycosyltransferase involved in cell wall biosynthesis